MARIKFNWKVLIVFAASLMVVVTTAFCLRQWQRSRMAQTAYGQGLKAYESRLWEEAVNNLGRYLAVDPANTEILFKYAAAQLNIRPIKSGNIKQAAAAYRRILRIDKNNSKATETLVSLYLETNIATEAELIARRYLQSNKDAKIDTMLAIALAKQRKFKEAASELKSIIKAYPQHVQAYEVLGRLTEHHPADISITAEYWFNEMVKNNPSSASGFIARAGYYLRKRETAKAIEDLGKAEKLDLSDLNVRLKLAREFAKAEMLEKARNQLENIYAQDSTNQQLWQLRAVVAMKAGSKKEMLGVAEAGLKQLKPDVWDFMPVATELFIKGRDYDKGENCLARLKQKDIEPVIILLLEGMLAQSKGQDYKAISYLLQAQQLGDRSQRSYLALAKLYEREGDMQSAILQLHKLISGEPYSLRSHIALARLLGQTGKWAKAVEQARLAKQIAPDNINAALLFLQTQLELTARGQNPNKKQIYQRIETQLAQFENPAGSSFAVKQLQFRLAMLSGKFTQAEQILLELKTHHSGLIEVLTDQIELFIAEGKVDKAIAQLYMHIEKFPGDVTAVKYLAELLTRYRSNEDCEKMVKDVMPRCETVRDRRDLVLLLAGFYNQWNQNDKSFELLSEFSHELPNDIAIKRLLLKCEQVRENVDSAQQLIDEIKSLEGEDGWQWRYEQANLRLDNDFEKHYPQIIVLLKKNLDMNPADQKSRLLLAAAYNKAGEVQLAVATYRRALDQSPQDLSVMVPAISAMYKAREYDQADRILNRAARQKIIHPQLSKLQVQRYLRTDKLDSAESVLEDLSARQPNNTSVCFALALLKMKLNKYDQAGELLNELRNKQPHSLAVTAALVELNLHQKKHEEALELCNKTIDQLANASAYILRGKTYLMLGQNDKALENFEQATAIEPNSVHGWVSKSDFHRSTGQSKQALEDIRKAMLLEPTNVSVQKRMIAILLSSGESEKILQGRQLLDKALISNRHDSELKLYKARCLLADGTAPTTEQAEHILEEITRQQPKSIETWKLWAQIYLKRAEFGKTMDIILRGLTYSPNNKDLLLFKARTEATLSAKVAIPTLKVLNDSYPDDTDIIFELAKVYTQTAQHDKAITLLENHLFRFEEHNHTKVNIALARVQYKNGQKDQSKERFDLLYDRQPANPKILLADVSLLKDEQKWDTIYQKSIEWLGNNPNDVDTLVTIARNLITTKNDVALNTAENLLRRVLDHDPNCLQAMTSLAMLLQITGRADGSAKLYNKVLQIEPDALMVLNNLTWIMCEQQGKYYQALELAQSGLRRVPEYIDLLDTRGMIYYRLGQYDKAVEDFSRCIELYPENSLSLAGSHFHLAKALIAVGQDKKALYNLRRTLDLIDKNGGLSPTEITEAQKLLKELLNKNDDYVSFTN